MHQRKNNLQELLGDELASVLAANCCGRAGAVSSGAQMRCNPPETFGGAWGSSRSPKEGDSLPIFILLPSLWGTSPFPVLALLRSRSACSSFLRFQHGNKAPSEAFSEGFCAPCAAQRLPQVRQRQSQDRRLRCFGFAGRAEARSQLGWAGLGGATKSQMFGVGSWKTRVRRMAQCSGQRDRMWGTTPGSRG